MEDSLLLSKQETGSGCGAAVTRFIGEVKDEGQRLGYIAGPMAVVILSQYLLQVVSSMMVGHLGELALSSSAIATSLSAVTGFSLLVGMGSGLDTLCGQAYGAKQYNKLSRHTYSASISLLLICIPVSLLWSSLGTLLTFVGIDPVISHEAAKYSIWMIPALLGSAVTQPMLKFLQCQSLTIPMMLIAIVTLCLHIPLSFILVFKSGFGFVGAALSISISYWIYACMLALYIKYSKACAGTRAPITMEAFRIYEFLRIAFPSAIMTWYIYLSNFMNVVREKKKTLCLIYAICMVYSLEWWSFELLVLLSGLLPNPELEVSVLSICLSIITCLYMIPIGLGAGVSTRISNELGGGNHEEARRVLRVALFIAVIVSFATAIPLFLLHGVIGYAYSNEKEVVGYIKQMAPLVCLSVISDCFQGILTGVARGCGWQHIGAFANFGAYYLIGIPIAVALAFVWNLGGTGLWIGILCGATVQNILLAIVSGCTNWEKQVIKARERVFNGSLPVTLK